MLAFSVFRISVQVMLSARVFANFQLLAGTASIRVISIWVEPATMPERFFIGYGIPYTAAIQNNAGKQTRGYGFSSSNV